MSASNAPQSFIHPSINSSIPTPNQLKKQEHVLIDKFGRLRRNSQDWKRNKTCMHCKWGSYKIKHKPMKIKHAIDIKHGLELRRPNIACMHMNRPIHSLDLLKMDPNTLPRPLLNLQKPQTQLLKVPKKRKDKNPYKQGFACYKSRFLIRACLVILP